MVQCGEDSPPCLGIETAVEHVHPGGVVDVMAQAGVTTLTFHPAQAVVTRDLVDDPPTVAGELLGRHPPGRPGQLHVRGRPQRLEPPAPASPSPRRARRHVPRRSSPATAQRSSPVLRPTSRPVGQPDVASRPPIRTAEARTSTGAAERPSPCNSSARDAIRAFTTSRYPCTRRTRLPVETRPPASHESTSTRVSATRRPTRRSHVDLSVVDEHVFDPTRRTVRSSTSSRRGSRSGKLASSGAAPR